MSDIFSAIRALETSPYNYEVGDNGNDVVVDKDDVDNLQKLLPPFKIH